MKHEIIVRDAVREDCEAIFDMVKEMAGAGDDNTLFMGNAKGFERLLFDDKGAHGVIGIMDGEPVGYCFYIYSASSLNCMVSITMNNFFVKKSARRNGVGEKMFRFMQQKCLDQELLGLEWCPGALGPEAVIFSDAMGLKPEAMRFQYHWNTGIQPPEAR